MGGRGSSTPISGALSGRRAGDMDIVLNGITKQQALYYATLAGVANSLVNKGDNLIVTKNGNIVSVVFNGASTSLTASINVPDRKVSNNSFSGEGKSIRDALQDRIMKKSTYELIG